MPKRLKLRQTLSQKEAKELLFAFIRNGDHPRDELRTQDDVNVEAILRAEGYPWVPTLVALRKNLHSHIPIFERFLIHGPHTVEIVGGGSGTIQVVQAGITVFESEIGDGVTFDIGPEATFQSACLARDAVIATGSLEDLRTMAVKAFSSIEAFFNLQAAIYNNNSNPSTEVLTDSSNITLKTKITEWLPLIAQGRRINLEKASGWPMVLRLMDFRNNSAIHPKPLVGGLTIEQVCSLINDFRGFAGLMWGCHHVCGLSSSRDILRASLLPQVETEEYID